MSATYKDDIVSSVAPRWAWDMVDEALAKLAKDRTAAGVEAESAAAAMTLACELADDEPISRDDPRLKEVLA